MNVILSRYLRDENYTLVSLFVWLVAGADLFWEKKHCWLVAGDWFVLREKYYWLVGDKSNEQGAQFGTKICGIEDVGKDSRWIIVSFCSLNFCWILWWRATTDDKVARTSQSLHTSPTPKVADYVSVSRKSTRQRWAQVPRTDEISNGPREPWAHSSPLTWNSRAGPGRRQALPRPPPYLPCWAHPSHIQAGGKLSHTLPPCAPQVPQPMFCKRHLDITPILPFLLTQQADSLLTSSHLGMFYAVDWFQILNMLVSLCMCHQVPFLSKKMPSYLSSRTKTSATWLGFSVYIYIYALNLRQAIICQQWIDQLPGMCSAQCFFPLYA
jgi:hypothetical protein